MAFGPKNCDMKLYTSLDSSAILANYENITESVKHSFFAVSRIFSNIVSNRSLSPKFEDLGASDSFFEIISAILLIYFCEKIFVKHTFSSSIGYSLNKP